MKVSRTIVSEHTKVIAGQPDPDYECAFRATAATTHQRCAEDWARATFESIPRPLRALLRIGWRSALGLRLGPYPSPDHILGWRIGTQEANHVVLLQRSALIEAYNVVEVTEAHVTWSTLVNYRHPAARPVWGLAAPIHQLILPLLVHRVCRTR